MRDQFTLLPESFWQYNIYKYLFFVSSFRFNPVNSVSMAENKNISTVNNFVYDIQNTFNIIPVAPACSGFA